MPPGEQHRTNRRPWIRRKRNAIPLGFLAAGLVFAVVAYVNPWPAALLIRALFTDGGTKTAEAMEEYAPPAELIESTLDQTYQTTAVGGSATDRQFDVFSPTGGSEALPTVIWIHGGAWISGVKENVDPYVRILAAQGYTTVSLNYTVGPEAIYPVAVTQLNDALAYLVAHAAEYRIDPDRLVIAGDSAGAQLTSQLAAMITNPDYAATVGIEPSLTPKQLRGVILNCGIYDVSEIPNAPGIGGWGFRTALWAYLGEKDWAHTPGGEEMSTIDDVTAAFPTTWISGGNADPLTATQSEPMAAKLTELGVDVTSVFYPDDTVPALEHEYQFKLGLDAAQSALTSVIDWLATVTQPTGPEVPDEIIQPDPPPSD
jgi:acetyl esterase/lipase